jgi:hypothetical protein
MICAAVAVAFLCAHVARSAVVTSVPMGGTMVHVNILYLAADSRLEAHVDPIIPQLAPLDVTNPADNFSSSDPWFPGLDPSGAGLAFNRQYGFVMDAASDPVPVDIGIWVRSLSLTPGLAAHRYKSTEPKAWEPILGAAGSTNVWQWNLAMFHPAMAAPPVNGSHAATFEAFAVDLSTGQAKANITPAPFTLNWTILPSARPVLTLGNDQILRWPATATNYVLQAASALGASWVVVTNSPVLFDGQCTLPVSQLLDTRFYRLKRVP